MPNPSELDQHWHDIITALPSGAFTDFQQQAAFGMRLAMAVMAKSSRVKLKYLEVGVRLGHSMAAVLLAAGKDLEYAVGVDCFIPGYGDEDNPGPKQVTEWFEDLDIDTKKVTLHAADSHVKLKQMGKAKRRFNLILVDGDHTESGAMQDLEDAWALLSPGGTLVFDDTVVKGDMMLLRVWRQFIGDRMDQIATHHEVTDAPSYATLTRSKLR
jgi:predicted O-methyltransferase YrrM